MTMRGGVAQKLPALVALLYRDDGNRGRLLATGAERSTGWSFTMPASAVFAMPAPMDAGYVGDGGAVCELFLPSRRKYDVHICSPFLFRRAQKRLHDRFRSEGAPCARLCDKNNEAAPLFARRLRLRTEVVTARRAPD